jgi:hypothetical protein
MQLHETEQSNMNTLTKQEAIELGGNVWEKHTIQRVYMSIEVIDALAKKQGYAELSNVSKKMKQAKTYLDCNTGEIKSDVGMIRSHLCSIGFNCQK